MRPTSLVVHAQITAFAAIAMLFLGGCLRRNPAYCIEPEHCEEGYVCVGHRCVLPPDASDFGDGATDAESDAVLSDVRVVDSRCPGDRDCDGDPDSTDCAPDNPDVHHGQQEKCSTPVDDDCNGSNNDDGAQGCTPHYYDSDDDDYGKIPPDVRCLCADSGNYRGTQANDCFDANRDAHPGQTAFFTANRGDGSFDYNCDGRADKQYPLAVCSTSGPCTLIVRGFYPGGLDHATPLPNCGEEGSMVDSCMDSFGCLADFFNTPTVKQGCR